MALPNTRKLATTFVYGGMAFKLSPLVGKLEAFEESVGMDYFAFVDSCIGYIDAEGVAITGNPHLISKLFFSLQDNAETYTRDEIHEWLFADVTTYSAEDVQKHLLSVLMALKGVDYQLAIQKVTAKKKAPPKERQPTAD